MEFVVLITVIRDKNIIFNQFSLRAGVQASHYGLVVIAWTYIHLYTT